MAHGNRNEEMFKDSTGHPKKRALLGPTGPPGTRINARGGSLAVTDHRAAIPLEKGCASEEPSMDKKQTSALSSRGGP